MQGRAGGLRRPGVRLVRAPLMRQRMGAASMRAGTGAGMSALQVAFHVGVHATDEDRLYRSLRQNARALRRQGVELCDNAANEPILNEALRALKGGTASPEMEAIVLDALIEAESPRRLVMSRATFLGLPRRALMGDGLMLYAGAKMRDLANVLPGAQAEFFMALRNPAVLICDLVRRNAQGYEQLMGRTDPMSKRWAPVLRRAVQDLRGRRLLVWCHEDLPMIFPEVLRRLAGVGPELALKGEDRLLRELLTEPGIEAMASRITADMTIEARRKATEALLAEFARPDQLVMNIDLPGWTPELVAEMTEAYYRDIAEIAALPGIEFISA